jgi:DNA-binding winged helix-turn-helix (wHTH) protein/TolB-like protein
MKTMSEEMECSYEFGPFRLDPVKRLLLRGGSVVSLTPKVFDTLLVLVRNGGRTLGKEELMRELWPDSFVEESNLAQNVFQLRKALGEGGPAQHYIETIPKKGYRFVADVKEALPRGAGPPGTAGSGLAAPREEEGTAGVEGPPGGGALQPHTPAAPGARRRRLMFPPLLAAFAAAILPTLYWWAPVRAPAADEQAARTIAVLPFKPLVAADDHEQLRMGMADALIVKLSNLRQLVVRPISSVVRDRVAATDPLSAGRQLGVDVVLDGTIQRSGDRVRVSVQLLRVRDGVPLWADRFDETFTNVFAVQDSIAEQTAQALALKLSSEERRALTKRHTASPEAYQEYVKGRYFWNKRTGEGLRKGIEHFRRAIEIDPSYALAYAGLADCYNLLTYYSGLPPSETFPKARAAAARALELDDTLAEAHASLGYVLMMYEWDWRGAERSLRRAIELNPNYATARHWHSEYLMTRGLHEASISEARRAVDLDPLSPVLYTNLGRAYFLAGDIEQSIEQYQKALGLEPDLPIARMHLGRAYLEKGLPEQALAEVKEVESDVGGTVPTVVLGYIYSRTGRAAETRKLLNQVTAARRDGYVPPYTLAMLHADLGEKDAAFLWLEKAYEERAELLLYLKVDPRFASLRPDPRFTSLLERVGLAE